MESNIFHNLRINKKLEQMQPSEVRIREAFLRSRVPLSPAGEVLKQRIEANEFIDISELPTVENPHLELFESLDIPQEFANKLFGLDLANVQVTKGCTRQCTFCAAGAGTLKKKDIMPFVRVTQIANEKKRIDHSLTPVTEEEWNEENHMLDEEYRKRGFSPMRIELSKQYAKPSFMHNLLLEKNADYVTVPYESDQSQRTPYFTNYYDSDPFDYQDTTFLHEDGTSADYGDVFSALSSEARPIHITTAGWLINNTLAQRAAEKVAATIRKNPALSGGIRISINASEITARRDSAAYLEQMKQVIKTFHDVKPQILIFDDKQNSDFRDQVIRPLKDFCKQYEGVRIQAPEISEFSGHQGIDDDSDDHDVMSCMPGWHILPDGNIAWQELGKKGEGEFGAPKGSRPIITGNRLYSAAVI